MKLIDTIFILFLFCPILKSQTQSQILYDAGTNIGIGTGADVCAGTIILNGTYSGGGTICSGVLPISMISFSSSVSKRDVILTWSTSYELNNTGFEVYRKFKNKNDWTKIGFVSGSGIINNKRDYNFKDLKLQAGTYNYKLKQIDFNGNFEYYMLANDPTISKPGNADVSQNYPNPSNPKSKIDYQIPFDGKVTIKVYDIIGREVATLVNEIKEAGYYTAEFDGTNLASGVYIYRINTSSFSDTKKMVLVK